MLFWVNKIDPYLHITPGAPLVIKQNFSEPPLAALQHIVGDKIHTNTTLQKWFAKTLPIKAPAPQKTSSQKTSIQTVSKVNFKENLRAGKKWAAQSKSLVPSHFNLKPLVVSQKRPAFNPNDQIRLSTSVANSLSHMLEDLSRIVKKNKNKIATKKQNAEQTLAKKSHTDQAGAKNPVRRNGIALSTFKPNTTTQKVIQGSLVFKDGLGADGKHINVGIYHIKNGHVLSKASVFLQDASFSLALKEPGGVVVGEARTSSGQLLGYGESDVQQSATDLHLVLKPRFSGLRAAVVSGNRFKWNPKTMMDAVLHVDGIGLRIANTPRGIYLDSAFQESSTFFLRARHRNHWNTISPGVSGTAEHLVKLFPSSMVKSLLKSVLAKKALPHALKKGVVWGQITGGSKPLSGAQVEVAENSQFKSDARVVYFQNIVPDPNLSATSNNGMFAVVNVEPGPVSLRVRFKNELWPAQIALVEEQSVSYVDINTTHYEPTPVRVYDALNNKEQSASVKILGLSQDHFFPEPNKDQAIRFAKGSGLFFVEAQGEKEFASSQYLMPRNIKHLDVPLVRDDWLQDLAAQSKTKISLTDGVVVGFVKNSRFAVKLNYKTNFEHKPGDLERYTFYFDKNGKILKNNKNKQTLGEEGGGFVIFNVPPGLHTLSLLTDQSNKILTRIVAVDRLKVSVLDLDMGLKSKKTT